MISGGANLPRESLFSLRAFRQHNSSLSSLIFDDCTTYCSKIQIHSSCSFLSLCQHQILLDTRVFRVSTPEYPHLTSCNHCVNSVTADLLTVIKAGSHGRHSVVHSLGTFEQNRPIFGLGRLHPVAEHRSRNTSKTRSWPHRCRGRTPFVSFLQELTFDRD